MNVAEIAVRIAVQRRDSLARLVPVGQVAAKQANAAITALQDGRQRLVSMEAEFAIRTGGIQDFWPTPYALARRMVAMAGIRPGMRVLEPSAGTGRIADAIRQAGCEPVCVGWYQSCRDILVAKGYKVEYCDFISYNVKDWAAIVSNPPFKHDDDHIRHAYDLLAPGGILVAIASEGLFTRQHKADVAFREWFWERGGESEQLRDAFVGSGTGVHARLLVIRKQDTK